MALTWTTVLPVIIVSSLIIYEEWASTPSCKPTNAADFCGKGYESKEEDLKVMMVANLHLLGSDSGFVNLYFRDYYMSMFFKKSFTSLKPDMLLVLGDVSAKGSELTQTKWVSVVHQFQQMVGPFMGLPYHVVVGDRDVGECSGLESNSVQWIARSFPGLDSAGCGAFEISNVSFVSLNAVALLCGNNGLRFSVEKVIERESVDLQMGFENSFEDLKDKEISRGFGWRENYVSSGSGPVLLLHFPLHHPAYCNCCNCRSGSPSQKGLSTLDSRGFAGTGPYELMHTVPPNATEYIFQALKPRIIFSAHTHEFSDYTHSDGTREVTVPSMTWKARDDPGFILATFQSNRAVSVSYCSLPRESHVLIFFTSIVVLLLSMMLIANTPQVLCLRL
ncbi:hypothetical protein CFOL_v3_02808 [Cephalotus follicularis]|uniref:Calcineurin-like phosphoesterase domain-containing protein n=1 Tax=Cephalotus follicularis TaxID=3775 RepID=A0A1Q3AU64_CEPFO|nr:hypothetical protein CFOL_v3_02808 [Cephalotus follicularis]